MSMLQTAIEWAVKAHLNQFDKAGKPYILHPLQVMLSAQSQYPKNPHLFPVYTIEEIMIAAVLHDVVEDTQVTLEEIEKEFGLHITRVVDGVTRRKEETYKQFIQRAKQGIGSRFLKRVDVEINLGRIHTLPPAEQSISKRYEHALSELAFTEGEAALLVTLTGGDSRGGNNVQGLILP